MPNNFRVIDLVCGACVHDPSLTRIVRSVGKKGTCVICAKLRATVTIEALAKIIDPFFREYFFQGEWNTHWYGGEDGYMRDYQDGENLSEVLQWMIGPLPFEDALIDALIGTYRQEPGEPFEPFYGEDVHYNENMRGRARSSQRWHQIETRIKFRQRYFDPEVGQFFKEILSDLNRQIGMDVKTATHCKVLQTVPARTKIWRGRKCTNHAELEQYLMNPEKKLGPPPSIMARAGRMNSEGVAVFYGSRESKTCAAEMRPSIGEHVVIGEFETNRPLLLLNFLLLDKSNMPRPSYFDEKFVEKEDKRRFISRLHRLISKPVVPGFERDYLITQALSEYLAHMHSPRIDGLIFNSVQEEGGENIVLFLRAKEDSTEMDSDEFDLPATLTNEAPKLVSTLKIQYEFDPIDYIIMKDGRIHIELS